MGLINWQDFEKIELRVGTIVKAEEYPEARNPAYILYVDMGEELGIKKSSAQITENYNTQELIGRQVICVANFPPKQIGKIMSELLVTGFPDESGNVILAKPDKSVPNGAKLY